MMKRRIVKDLFILIIIAAPIILFFLHFAEYCCVISDALSKFPHGGLKTMAIFSAPIINLILYPLAFRLERWNLFGKTSYSARKKIRFAEHFLLSFIFCVNVPKYLKSEFDFMLIIRYIELLTLIVVGSLFPLFKPNLTIGFRINWIMENEKIWKLTHIFARRVWTSASVATMLILPTLSGKQRNFIILSLLVILLVLPLLYARSLRSGLR